MLKNPLQSCHSIELLLMVHDTYRKMAVIDHRKIGTTKLRWTNVIQKDKKKTGAQREEEQLQKNFEKPNRKKVIEEEEVWCCFHTWSK